MIDAVGYIIDKWDLRWGDFTLLPIQIPNTSRQDLAELFCELGYRTGAEIGIGTGTNAMTLKRKNPELILYCVDSWEIYDGIHDFTDPRQMKEFYVLATHRFKSYKDIHIINKLSMDAVKDFDDNSLDFVYIDANHEWPYVTQDLFYWSKKVRPGGIVSGHDYFKGQRADGLVHVREAVHSYAEAYHIKPFFVMDECTQERAGSFLWVKE